MAKNSKRKSEIVETIIGTRSDGVLIKEDGNGTRFYVENGIRISEPVMLVPGRQGFTFEKGELGTEFMTEAESELQRKGAQESLTILETERFKINILSDSSVGYFLANNTIDGPKNGWRLISTLEGYHFINPIEKLGIDCIDNQRALIEEYFAEFVSCFNENNTVSENDNHEEISELVRKIQNISVKTNLNDSESITSNLVEKVAETTFFINPKNEKVVDLSIEQRQAYVDLFNSNWSPESRSAISPFLIDNRFFVFIPEDGLPMAAEIKQDGSVIKLNHTDINIMKEDIQASKIELVEFMIPLNKQGKHIRVDDDEDTDSHDIDNDGDESSGEEAENEATIEIENQDKIVAKAPQDQLEKTLKPNETKEISPSILIQNRLDSISNSLKYREQHLKIQEMHSIKWILNIIKADETEFFSKVHSYIVQLEDRFSGLDNKAKSEAINKTIAIKILNQPYPEYDSSSLAAQISTIAKKYPIFEYAQSKVKEEIDEPDVDILDDWIHQQTGICEFSIVTSERILKESKINIQSDCSRAWVLTGDKLTQVERDRLDKIDQIVKAIQTNPILGEISLSKITGLKSNVSFTP